MIVILFFTIFAVMGITLFKGYFEYCMISPNDSGKLEQLILNDIIDNKYKCINYGGEWQTYYKNFDDLGTALIQTVTMSQTVGWAEFMYRAMHSNGPGAQASKDDKSYFASLYFAFYVVFGAFFITNLFVGIVISTYNREKDRLGKNFILSEDQKKWIETKLLVVRIKPKRINQRPRHPCRGRVFDFAENRYFDIFILVCISLNAILMSVKYVGISDEVQDGI